MTRQQGTTSRQIREAPVGAIFIWCNSRTEYPDALARMIGRIDLAFQSPRFFDDGWWCDIRQAVVVDHFAPRMLSPAQWRAYDECSAQLEVMGIAGGIAGRHRLMQRLYEAHERSYGLETSGALPVTRMDLRRLYSEILDGCSPVVPAWAVAALEAA